MKTLHPFFLLGLLAAVTQHQTSLNLYIHEHFLRVLAERVVVRAEKSLDLLQGMLAQLSRSVLSANPVSHCLIGARKVSAASRS